MSKRKNTNTVVTRIIAEFKDHNRADIKKWRNALALAQNIYSPYVSIARPL